MNKELDGKLENLKGRAKQAAGTVTGDKELEAEGAVDRAKGAVKEGFEKAKRNLRDATEPEPDEEETPRGRV
ncbi:MAG TPA: CsbD family protein [Polyangia bacterium]